ncbi:hypothetical protein TEA_021350 [Camellia sinensis var. sinensis]|uniref:pyruvate kinase n=1 Tax=Camellia sinensis var. sinensis TaxID=542762 RepID=A0A4S4DNK0_CAMSN|nr:hypothetical protein TEA_021350 [Camellia sinensis var. sinensis]
MDSSFLEDPHPISPHLRPTSHATTSATAAAASPRVFRHLGRGSIPCSVRISFQSANMHANHLLLEEPIRMASILEPSRANFFPATTKIVGTLGPRSRSVEVISGCLKAGMSVARFDFSLGDPEYHQETLENLRAAVKTTYKLCAFVCMENVLYEKLFPMFVGGGGMKVAAAVMVGGDRRIMGPILHGILNLEHLFWDGLHGKSFVKRPSNKKPLLQTVEEMFSNVVITCLLFVEKERLCLVYSIAMETG